MEAEDTNRSNTSGLLSTLVLATAASYPLGLFLGQPWLLPVLNAAPAYAIMIARLARGDRRGAVKAVLVWALAVGVCATVTFALWPALARGVVIQGPEYQDEMFRWIRTGEGREGRPTLFLPQHLLHLGAFVVLSLVTAGALSILAGAVLVNDMAFYVASLATAGVPTWAVVFLGWQPWALCRVAAYGTLGAVLAEPLLFRILERPRPAGMRPYVRWAVVGILADWVLKAFLAPTWGLWLRALLP